MAEAGMAAQHRGAAEMHFAGLQHDGLVQRQLAGFVVFAEEDAKQDSVARNLHRHVHFKVPSPDARTWPIHTATMQHTTETTTLPPARSHSPSFIRFSVCRLNDE